MKGLLTALLFIGLFVAADTIKATNYYFSSSLGDDSRISLQAQNPLTPWKTLDKLNSFFSRLQPGDSILFKRGDIFYGNIAVNKSGTSNSPITLSAYGSGSKPVITGLANVNSWISIGGNIWESTDAISTLPNVSIVTVGDTIAAMGRYPNSGYLPVNSHVGKISITSNSLSGSFNWNGGEIVIKKQRWILDRNLIISHLGSTINYLSASIYDAQDGWGFFIQGHPNTLDQQNEWYYNPLTKKIRVYSTTNPENVQVSAVDNLMTSIHKNYITFDDLSFSGANTNAFFIGSSIGITIQNCDIHLCNNGVYGTNFGSSSANFKIQNSSINRINNNAITLPNEFKSAYIGHNIIQDIAMITGMGNSGEGMYQAINSSGANTVIEYNNIINTGYIPIGFAGNSVIVNNNYVNNYCSIKDDGGGIYCGNNENGKIISNNIVLNGIGAGAGTNAPSVNSAFGIYIDGNSSSGVSILNNSIANGGRAGIFLHNPHDLTVTGNTVYDHPASFLIVNDHVGTVISGLSVTNNIFFAKTSAEVCANYTSLHNDLNKFGTIDYNYYAKPINDNIVFNIKPTGGTQNNYSLAGWKTYSGLDLNSKKSPRKITTINDLRFEYNATPLNKIINLGATYIGVDSVTYPGTITLAPYTSVVLIYISSTIANQAPSANAGVDQNFFLPNTTTTLTGNGDDVDGSIVSYQWTKISGPDQFTIVSPDQAQTEINDLVEGIYQFELKVIDNLDAVGRDTIIVTVNTPAPNQPPVANAGPDQDTSLPIDTITLNGNGYDTDGNIVSYQWTKISGPDQFTIVSPDQAQTEINDLVEGVYQFELKVTDNLDAVGRDTIIITVNTPAPNQHPVANAGPDQDISLPIDAVTVNGSGYDTDGNIVSYQWTKISGPGQFTIASSTQAQVFITNLIEGIYQFELQVTDNLGAIGKDTVTVGVTLNIVTPIQPVISNTNQLPVANTGLDINMTLPTNAVLLIGSGYDADGIIVSYQWTKISGPRLYTILSANQAEAVISNLLQGIYQFELEVLDDLGAIGRDTVAIVVNPPFTEQFFIAKEANNLNVAFSTNTMIYPNPATEFVNIKINALLLSSTPNTRINTVNGIATSIRIYNSIGILVHEEQLALNQQTTIKQISVKKFPAGIYLVEISSDSNSKQTLKLVKQ